MSIPHKNITVINKTLSDNLFVSMFDFAQIDISKNKNFYVYCMSIANTGSSEAIVSVYHGIRQEDNLDYGVVKHRDLDYRSKTPLAEYYKYIIKQVKIPVGTTLKLEVEDLYFPLDHSLFVTQTTSINLDISLKLANLNITKNNNNTY